MMLVIIFEQIFLLNIEKHIFFYRLSRASTFPDNKHKEAPFYFFIQNRDI